MNSPFAALREWIARLTGTILHARSDGDLRRELEQHLELAEERLRALGHSPKQARRMARIEAGKIVESMEALREQRGIPPLSTFWLDFRLGLRMLRKHWALTLIGGLAIACAMTVSASIYDLIAALEGARIPLEEGDRVVIMQPFDPETQQRQNATAQVFEHWRGEMDSLVDVGAFRTLERTLTTANGAAPPAATAEMSAAGFDLARIEPLMGRRLLPEDERADQPPVVVIGYDAWQSTFVGDPDIVGRQIQLDGVSHTIVGVMPEGFRFPLNHQYWTSLKARPMDRVTVFARFAPDATLEGAQSEIEAVGFGDSMSFTDSGRPLRPFVRPYVIGLTGSPRSAILTILPFLLPLLLLPPCTNIGVLIYARTVSRQGEFAVRTALGASRGRIISQIFVEVLVLAAGAAGIAVLLAPPLAERLSYMVSFNQPFWMDFGFSYRTILFAAALALVAAVIAGAIPALRATERLQLAGLDSLHRASPPRLGRTWTLIVTAQVALSVAVVPTAVEFAWNMLRPAILGPGFGIDEFLTARLDLPAGGDPAAAAARFNALRTEVVRQLEAEPGVVAVTMSESKPFEDQNRTVEADSAGFTRGSQSIAFNRVDSAFFDVFGIRRLAGRGFEAADSDPQRGTILVNRRFVDRVLAGENPLGRTVRVTGPNTPETSYEIVGLVEDQFAYSDQPTMYRPLTPGDGLSVHLAIHTDSTVPTDFGIRLREVTSGIARDLRTDDVQPMSEIYFFLSLPEYIFGSGPVLVVLGVLFFAMVGIFTHMSFAVVERRREIGIRAALGASPSRLIFGFFRTIFVPVVAGVAIGGSTALILDFYLSPLLFNYAEGGRPLPWVLPAAEAFVLLMGVIAVFGPVRRALRVDATEALRES